MKTLSLKIGLVCATLLLGALPITALEGFVVIAHEGVSASSLSAAALKDIYTGKTMYWEGGQAVVLVVPGDKADAALEQASGMNASAFKTFWQRLVFSGRGLQPKKADDSAGAVALVASTKGAVSVVPASTDLKGVKKIEVK